MSSPHFVQIHKAVQAPHFAPWELSLTPAVRPFILVGNSCKMWMWNKTFKTSQSGAWQPGFCDSKALLFHSFCCSLPGCQNLWLRDEGWITWTWQCKGSLLTQGNPRGQALSGFRLPWSQLKDHPEKLFLAQPTQSKTPSQAWLLSKTAVGWQERRQTLTDVFASDHLQGSLLLSCLVINAWTRAEALEFGSDHSLKSCGPAFQLKSKMSSEPEAASCTDSEQWHSEWWLYLWRNGLFLCQEATSAPRGALSLRSHFSSAPSPQPPTLESSCRFTPFLSPFWNILAC